MSNMHEEAGKRKEHARRQGYANGADHSPCETLTAALYYYDRGYFVVPCCVMNEQGECTFPHKHTTEKSIGKIPLLGEGWQHARLSRDEIIEWWTHHPSANVGVLLEPSGLLAVDLDSEEATEEANRKGLPPGPQVRGARGVHHYFRNPKKIIGLTIKQGTSRAIDVLSKGIVVGFNSIHRTGRRYELLTSWEEWELEEPPLWAEQLLLDSLKNHGPAADIADDLPPVDLEALQLPRWLSSLILHGQPPRPSNPYPSRSEAVWAVVTALVEAGHASDIIASILLDPRYKISAKPREQGTRWVASEIGRARAKTQANGNGSAQGEQAAGTTQQKKTVTFPLTDTGNSERLAHRYGDVLRWCETWKKWTYYDGKQWQVDNSNQAKRCAKETIRQIYAEASQADDDERRQKLAKFALQSESGKSRRELLELAKGEMPILPDAFDTNPWLLNCQNGTVDLETGKLRQHCKEDYLTKIVTCEYDEDANADEWEGFLEKIFANNQELIDWLQRAMGYSLTAQTREQIAFICHGGGSNGKSTLFETFRTTLGDYGEHASTSTFLHTEREAIRNDLAKLRSARLVTAVETEQGKRLAEALFKSATGEDPITARFLFSENFTFLPQFKIWLATNHKPEIRGTDHAIWRRIRLIPFTVTISEEEQDKQLPARLKAELPGILSWLVRGCLRWQKEGLTPAPEIVLQATKEYREEMDVIASFLAEKTSTLKGSTIPSTQLYEAYRAWTIANGNESETQMRFSLRLVERGIKKTRNTLTGKVQWHDLTLRTD